MPCFRIKIYHIPQQKQVTLPLQVQTSTNPLTEGFTETFTEGFQVHGQWKMGGIKSNRVPARTLCASLFAEKRIPTFVMLIGGASK
jgi:hypothetical protein